MWSMSTLKLYLFGGNPDFLQQKYSITIAKLRVSSFMFSLNESSLTTSLWFRSAKLSLVAIYHELSTTHVKETTICKFILWFCVSDVFLTGRQFPASFSLFSLQFSIQLIVNKIGRCLDSNRGHLRSEASALPTKSPPPLACLCCNDWVGK